MFVKYLDKFELKFCLFIIGIVLSAYIGIGLMVVVSVDVQKSTNFLYPDGTSTVTIGVVGINRFGTLIPFRNLDVNFLIEEGNEKVVLVKKESNKLILKARYEIGNVVVVIKNKYTVVPIRIEIPIVIPTA